MLQLTEEPADGFAFLGNAKFEKFATLFKDLNLLEMSHQEMQNSKAISLRAEEHDEVGQTHLTICIETSFEFEIRA